ncbi:MAG: carboxypeptidase [Gammaproteobacteria bacterium]|jgi:carboxypeptidase Q|nr:carboxypeptidase [Gammaproteobacteria bacterium]
MTCQPIRLLAALPALVLLSTLGFAQAPAAGDAALAETLARIREAALKDDWAYQRLTDLCDKIGPRLSGSAQAEAAVAQVAAALHDSGLAVTLQPARVPHWVRGEELADIIDYPGRPAGVTQHMHLTTLGNSVATPSQGLSAPILVVHSFDELKARADEARGRIVVYDVPYNQELAVNGRAGAAYGQGVVYRGAGASAAARVGAVAALVRTVGGADYRLPHTGAMNYEDGVAKIPTAALSAEDAMWLSRLAAQGSVKVHLKLTPQTLPEVDSHNVIAEWPGREQPDEVVIVSGHLDSWDLAQGAIDDGAGVASAMGAIEVLKSLGLHARRTVRFVAWMDEENGGAGAKAYFKANAASLNTHAAAIESDNGAGRPLGVSAHVLPESMKLLKPVVAALAPVGATLLEHRDGGAGADIDPLDEAGVPTLSPLVDTRKYFDYHHSPADTLDKVQAEDIRRQVAVLAVLAYYLAEMPEVLPRLPAGAKSR